MQSEQPIAPLAHAGWLTRVAEALDIPFWHYNASLLNFDLASRAGWTVRAPSRPGTSWRLSEEGESLGMLRERYYF